MASNRWSSTNYTNDKSPAPRPKPSSPKDWGCDRIRGVGAVTASSAATRAYVPEEGKKEEARWTLYRRVLGVGYLLVMGVCGAVNVGLGATLEGLASNCGTTSTEVGSVFVGQGVGGVIGPMICPKLYGAVRKNTALSLLLLVEMTFLVWMPFITSVGFLYLTFFAHGFIVSATITGLEIMTVSVHGINAGPWLGANSTIFVVAGLNATLIAYYTDSLFGPYIVLGAASGVVGIFIAFLPNPETIPGFLEEAPTSGAISIPDESEGKTPTMRLLLFCRKHGIELHISAILGLVLGSQVAATAYLTTYVDETGVFSTSYAEFLVVDLYIALVVGSLVGLVDQYFLTLPNLYWHLTILLFGGTIAIAAIIAFSSSAIVLWTGVACFGALNAPQWTYCVDLYNRVLAHSDTGMSILTFGTNVGSSLVPYLAASAWNYSGWPQSLFVVIIFSLIVSYPLMLNVKRLSEMASRGGSPPPRASDTGCETTREDNRDERTPLLS